MNAIVDAARQLVGSKTEVQSLAADIADIEAQLASAVAEADRLNRKHNAQLLEMTSEQAVKALAQSRTGIAVAEARVDDLRRALAGLQSKHASAVQAEEKKARQGQREAAEAIARDLEAETLMLQTHFASALAKLPRVFELNDQLFASLPTRPDFRPTASTGAALRNHVETFLFGLSEGLICQQPMSIYKAQSRGDLVTAAKAITAQLLRKDAA